MKAVETIEWGKRERGKMGKMRKGEFQPLLPPLDSLPQAAVDYFQCIELADQFVDGSHSIIF